VSEKTEKQLALFRAEDATYPEFQNELGYTSPAISISDANARLAALVEKLEALSIDIEDHYGHADWSSDEVNAVLREYRRLKERRG
jgi:DNA-binding ferritin-like protein